MLILHPGLCTSIQDLGRFGYQKLGFSPSGAMDSRALRMANILVGNAEHEAALEITVAGPELVFQEDTIIALCGANICPSINGEPIPNWKPILVSKNSHLKFGQLKTGCRAYLAVAGGIDSTAFLSSKSTYSHIAIPGIAKGTVAKNELIKVNQPSPLTQQVITHILNNQSQLAHIQRHEEFIEFNWAINYSHFYPDLTKEHHVQVILHPQLSLLTLESIAAFFSEAYQVSQASDRMGYRLEGPVLEFDTSKTILSNPVNMGSIEVPADGHPIILMTERATIGGYPMIGTANSTSLPILAQSKPGDTLRFAMITVEHAQKKLLQEEQAIMTMKQIVLSNYQQIVESIIHQKK
ncbi:5-oxoprolinase subunit C family protein [Legionella saoudiensis]|uniref:5-oxoprolinase subunit C family protein n=1 Tax=Legionella saoudiensis TaxID=1750561 RepID=UPI0007319AE9|nr:biotin-dependent carboxyltransferase family protein [Legionella saoudiensis]